MLPPGRARRSTKPVRDGIHGEHHDNRDGAGRVLRCRDRRVIGRHDDVDLEAHQLGGEVREPFGLPTRQAPFEGDVLPFHIPERAQSLAEGRPLRRRRRPHGLSPRQHPYPQTLLTGCAVVASGTVSRARTTTVTAYSVPFIVTSIVA